MDRKHIAIGIPTFGTVSMWWAHGYQNLSMPMNTCVARVVEQGFEISVARNRVVVQVLKMDPRPSHLFFLDDDVIPATQWPILRLLSHDVDIVAGVYFLKGEYGQPLAFPTPGGGAVNYNPQLGLVPVWGVGMGLTLIRTEVFERMRDELDLGVDELGNPRWFHTSGDKPGEDRYTEDLWFCNQAHKIGIDVHVDMNPQAFAWHYDLKKQIGYPRAQWESFLKTGTADWEVPD